MSTLLNYVLSPAADADGYYTLVEKKQTPTPIVTSDSVPVKLKANDSEVKKQTRDVYLDFHALMKNAEMKFGDVEPAFIKAARPYLMASEVSTSTIMKSNNKTKGRGKKKSKSIDSTVSKVYTPSNPPPAMMNYTSSNKPYRFTQTVAAANALTSSTTLSTFFATAFILNNLDQVSSLAAVFDQYMIEYVEVWFDPINQSNNGGLIYSVIDYDDANNLSTIPQFCDYNNVMISSATDGHYRRFRPHIAVAAYSGTFTSFANEPSCWIDCASASVQHFGFKAGVTPTASAEVFEIRYRYHLAFRNIR